MPWNSEKECSNQNAGVDYVEEPPFPEEVMACKDMAAGET